MNEKIWLMGWVRSGNAMRPVGAVDPTTRRTRQEQDEPKLVDFILPIWGSERN
jgi:hypothetical protein